MLKLADYAKMNAGQKRVALDALTDKPNGAVVRVEGEIRKLEQRYEMTSAEMRARVARGELDTAETARWLVMLDALGR